MDTNEIILLVNSETETTLKEFLHDNTAPDVDTPDSNELARVLSLKVGEFTYIGICQVERVK